MQKFHANLKSDLQFVLKIVFRQRSKNTNKSLPKIKLAKSQGEIENSVLAEPLSLTCRYWVEVFNIRLLNQK
jgi:hypothetical protein